LAGGDVRETVELLTGRGAPVRRVVEENPGRLYEVNINANPEDFLDWDKPLSEQPQRVREAFDGLGVEGRSGQGAYEELSWQDMGGSFSDADAGASRRLREAGIPGIRYLDAGSRGAGDGSRNYVVFNDRLVDILGKDGARNTPEGRAQEVLDMLASGRGAEVTDEMLDLGDPVQNARLNQYLFNNYDLPMDDASRMARAREMGMDTGLPLFHGGAEDFAAFDRANRGKTTSAMSAKRATWMAGDPDVAAGYATFAEGGPVQQLMDASYRAEADGNWDLAEDLMRQAEELELSGDAAQGGNVQSLLARGKRLAFDAEGEKYDANEYVMMDKVNAAQRGGYDGVQVDNFVDNADYSDWREASHVGVFDPANIRSRFARFDPRLAHLRNLSAGAAGAALMGDYLTPDQREAELRAYLEM